MIALRITMLLVTVLQTEEGWVTGVWGLPGAATQGHTYNEAIEALKEVYQLFVECAQEDGIPLRWDTSRDAWEGNAKLAWIRLAS